MKKYIIGVDGGNTKTDYFLFDLDGNAIDCYRAGTCSHEGLPDSFEGTYRVMKEVFSFFLGRNNLKAEDIYASVFGLAGVDTPIQKEKIENVITRLGFNNFKVVNDSFLGIKAGSLKGIGACSINGTGTSSGAIDKHGSYLQVGGIGGIVGDEAGGHHIARMAIKAVYTQAYRFGEKTTLHPIVMKFLDVQDKYYLMDAISYKLSQRIDTTPLVISVFDEASKGDNVSIKILKDVAEALARSVGGAIVNLDFDDDVDVILAGSVWVKGSCKVMLEEFTKLIKEYTKKSCNIIVLQVPPATGAIIWAYELATSKMPTEMVRDRIIQNVKDQLGKL